MNTKQCVEFINTVNLYDTLEATHQQPKFLGIERKPKSIEGMVSGLTLEGVELQVPSKPFGSEFLAAIHVVKIPYDQILDYGVVGNFIEENPELLRD